MYNYVYIYIRFRWARWHDLNPDVTASFRNGWTDAADLRLAAVRKEELRWHKSVLILGLWSGLQGSTAWSWKMRVSSSSWGYPQKRWMVFGNGEIP